MDQLLFQNVIVIDGTGEKGYLTDVGVRDGKIVIDPAWKDAERIIDGDGCVLFPGFVDAHSHGDAIADTDFGNLCKVAQGVTTQVAGQCGTSFFPNDPGHMEELRNVLSVICPNLPAEAARWTSFEEYRRAVESMDMALNMKVLVGHSNLRVAVMGLEDRKPTPEELEKMKDLLREAMEHGAMGLSTGLIYAPSCYADTEEIIELAKVAAEYGGIYETHMRNESDDVTGSVREALRIGREAGIAVEISHHKVCGRRNWGKSEETLALVEQAKEEGIKVTLDQYPYLALMTHLKMCVPPEYFAGGPERLAGMLKDPEVRETIRTAMLDPDTDYENQYQNCGSWDKIFISSLPKTPQYAGMTVAEAAEKMGKDPFEAYFDLLEWNDTVGNAIFESMCKEDLFRIIQCPDTVVGSDGIVHGRHDITHPRGWGTFPQAIRMFCVDNKVLSLEEMIHKMTLLPAQRAMIENKGAVLDGWDADLVLADMEQLTAGADYRDPTKLADGIRLVVVNGEIVFEDGALTGRYPGKLLLHKGI